MTRLSVFIAVQLPWAGVIESASTDGWVSIRQADGRLDEVRAEHVQPVDPPRLVAAEDAEAAARSVGL